MRRKKLPFLIIGLSILILFLFMALFPQAFTKMGRKESFGALLPPSSSHILGTNSLGYDIFTELVYGARETIVTALSAAILALTLGTIIGMLAGAKGFLGTLFGGITDMFIMLPKLIVLIVLSAFIGGSTVGLIVLIGIFCWTSTARAVRAKVIHLRSLSFIEGCKMYGYSPIHTAVRHIIPNLSDVLLSRFLLGINGCIMMESTLSFLGFGNLYYPTWGVMINFARSRGGIISGSIHYIFAPCVCIMLLSLSFYFIFIYLEGRRETLKDPEY